MIPEVPRQTKEDALAEFRHGIGESIFPTFSHHINQKELRVQANDRSGTELVGSLLVNPSERIRAEVRFGTFRDESGVLVYYLNIDQPGQLDMQRGRLWYYANGKHYARLEVVGEPDKPSFTKMLTGIANALPAPMSR